jgi:hypothetical protein
VGFPEDKRKLAKWLGVAHRAGQALCYYIQASTMEELENEQIQEARIALEC